MSKEAKKTAHTQVRREKILPVRELAAVTKGLRADGKVIVHCHGVFDLLHPGHLKYFKASKQEGDVLIVTITPDRLVNKGPGRPVFNEQLRAEWLAALEDVDYVAINEWPTAVEIINLLKPHVYSKGSDYKVASNDLTGKINDEERAIVGVGGRIHFTDEITFSSSGLLNNYFSVFAPEAKKYLDALKKKYSADDVIKKMASLKNMKVLVVGDTIIDEYRTCRVVGRASKTAALNTQFISSESHAGGILAIANHVAGFCKDVHLVTALGAQDSRREFIESHLKKNVSRKFFLAADRPTTVKCRFIESFRQQKMFEVTSINDQPLPPKTHGQLNEYLKKAIGKYDLVIVADFGHGLISGDTVGILSGKAKYLALNAQMNSMNMGFNPVTKYPRADYVCIDQEEMRFAYHDRFGPLEPLVTRAAKELRAKLVTVTRAQHGSTTFVPAKKTFHDTPVFSTEIVDTIGAGDAYLAVTAPCAAAGFDPALIGFIGNTVGAIAVRTLGNRESVEPVLLNKFFTTLLK